jgi:hypothetical protein
VSCMSIFVLVALIVALLTYIYSFFAMRSSYGD